MERADIVTEYPTGWCAGIQIVHAYKVCPHAAMLVCVCPSLSERARAHASLRVFALHIISVSLCVCVVVCTLVSMQTFAYVLIHCGERRMPR